MSDLTQKTGLCSGCNDTSVAFLHRHINQNGAEHFTWVCKNCGRKAPFGGPVYIAKDKVYAHIPEQEVEKLPVIMPVWVERCAVCGSRGAELHHWAPKGIFGEESSKWPQDYLCDVCHKRWHFMVTPQLVNP